MLKTDQIQTIIRDVLELPDDYVLREDAFPASVPGWDSMGWLNIIAAVEAALGKEIPLDALDDVATVGDVYTVLSHV